MVTSVIAEMIHKIDSLISTDSLLDKLESRKPGSKVSGEISLLILSNCKEFFPKLKDNIKKMRPFFYIC